MSDPCTSRSSRDKGFHLELGESIYPNMIERERRYLFGEESTCTLYAVTPGSGEEALIELRSHWSARRIPTIESGSDEQWRLEIASALVDWPLVRLVSTVRIVAGTGERQHYRVLQTENAMKPGHVYHLRIEAIDQR